MPELTSTRTSKWKVLLALVTILGLGASIWFIPQIQAAREEARNRPFVSVVGHGSSNHKTYHLSASGKSTPELDRRISSVLRDLVERLKADSQTHQQSGHRIFTGLYVHAPTLLTDSLAPLTDLDVGLDSITIEGVPVSYENILAISRCRSLTGVGIRNASITNESVIALSNLDSLRFLDVSGNPEITLSALTEVRRRNPNITIISEQSGEPELPSTTSH